jgi:2-methylcitrate dehydratase PrpD
MAATRKRMAQKDAPLAARMAAAAVDYSWQHLQPAAAAKAKLCVLDLLSSAFASSSLPWSRQAIALARRNSAGMTSGGAPIIGTPHVVSVHDAAFANGVLGHGLVRDDMHLGSVSHLGTVLVPTLLALAERGGATGQELLTALVVGYEAGGKLGRMILDVEVSKVFRPTGITGPFAGAAAAAKLMKLDAEQTATALALAANAAAGYNEWAATGGSEMFFHTGTAARSAVTAAELAAEGAYASPTAVDGEAGLLAAFRKALQPQVPELFANAPEIMAVFFKPVPACNFAQSPAQAAHRIARRERVRAADVERILVRVTRAAALYPGCNVSGPFEHILQAKMSIHYNVAAALATGNFDEGNYAPQGNPQVQRLATMTTLEVDAELTKAYPDQQGAEVIVYTKAGDTWSERVADVTPAPESEVRDRFAAAASSAVGNAAARDLAALIDDLEGCADVRELGRLVRAR